MSSLNMNYQFISLLLLSSCVYSEILTFTDSTPPVTDVIECQDATTECIINCNSTSICSNKELHCHATSQLSCTINLNANASATSATVYTHSSPTVHLNGNAVDCCHSMNVSAYEQGGTQLFVDSTFDGALQYAEIYGPVGFGSILWMKCSVYGCQNLRIYDDWSTTLRLEPTAIGAFKDSRVYNIFDSAGLGIARDDPNYNAADMDYRAPVYLLDCYGSQDAFVRVTIDGTNHGDWFVSGSGSYLWHYSTIYATTDDRVDQSIPYNVELYAANKLFPRFNFHAGAGADVLLDMEGGQALHTANIYAKSANSLTIYCNGGYCIHSNIECPDNTSPNSCNFVCESVAQCYGNDIEKPSTACDNLYLSSEMRDNKVYCGYDQTAAYCNYTSEGNNTVHSCSSGCGSPCAFDNAIVPTSIASKHTALCSETFITFPNTTTSTTPEPTTTTTTATTSTPPEPTTTTTTATTSTPPEPTTTTTTKENTAAISTMFANVYKEENAIIEKQWASPLVIFIVVISIGICLCVIFFCCFHKRIRNKDTPVDGNANPQGVPEWIETTLNMTQYMGNFLLNGFDTMEAMLAIENKEHLNEIGIVDTEHQCYIMKEINKLRNHGVKTVKDTNTVPLTAVALTEQNVVVDDSDDDIVKEVNQVTLGQDEERDGHGCDDEDQDILEEMVTIQ